MILNYDIFFNLFLHAYIKTACNLRILNKQTYKICDKHVLTSKLHYNVIFDSFTEWLNLYYEDYIKYNFPYNNYNDAVNKAIDIMNVARPSKLNIHVRISIRNHLIYKLLSINKSNYNTITFHINTNNISIRMIKLTALKRSYRQYDDYMIHCTRDAFLYYLTVILYDNKYDKIINDNMEEFL